VLLTVRELTPRGPGGVSVLAVHGPGALERVKELVPKARFVSGRPVFARLRAAGEELDEVLVCVPAPDEVEVHVHGSPPLVRRLARELGGEATQPERSVEARALASLAQAPCEAAARILLDQAEGALRRDVLAACALPSPGRRAALEELVERGRRTRPCFQPLEVVLAGPVNAGKSTLFNVLVGERRVVVSDEEGTTRDRVREPAQLGAWPIFLSDTAGDRALSGTDPDPQRAVEQTGQARARAARAEADLVLWLEAHGTERVEPDAGESPIVSFVTQGDRAGEMPAGGPRRTISALRDPEGARVHVLEAFLKAFDLPTDPWTPGAGVPFEEDQVRELAELAETEGSVVEAARKWLDGE
jgi:tRNA modification GTPase